MPAAPVAPVGTPGGVGYVDPFAATAQPNNGGNQALLVSSSPARAATTDNVTKLQQITAPPAAPTDTSGGTKTTPYLQEGIDKANNQGKEGYDVLGNPVADKPTPTTTGGTKDPYDSALSGIKDPGLAAQFKSSLQGLDSQISQAQSNMDNARALSQNDPAALAAIDGIKAKYETQIQLMRDRNRQLLGKANTSVAAFGGLGPMGQDFLNNQQQKADDRISTLQAQEQDAVTKMQIAYQTKDFKALDSATKAYDAANKGKLDALGKLLTETNKAVAQSQAAQKIQMQQDKAAQASELYKSVNDAPELAKRIAESGVTDQGQIDQYLEGYAQENGITNPDILKSQVEKARQASMKSLSGTANTLDTIRQRETPKPGKDPKKSFNASVAIATATPQFEKIKGDDGYIDPTKWIAARNTWMSLGGSETSFKSNFLHFLNPASYTKAGYKAPTTGTTPQYSTN